MKKQLIKGLIFTGLLFAGISLSFADSWMCKTNASSAPSGSPEAKADMEMDKMTKSAKEAFAFAYRHCRDCTKISCAKK